MKRKLFTVYVFSKLSTRRFFRDRLAIFFGIMFPLIFLFVFGFISKGNGNTSFNVALINQSDSAFAKQFDSQLRDSKTLKVDKAVTTVAQANDKMSKSQLDAVITLPKGFGQVKNDVPSGTAEVHYSQNSASAGQAVTTVLQGQFAELNQKLTKTAPPLHVTSAQNNERSLSSFDYTFAGLLGFSIVGMGIFGPVNVFPELKKQGILRRFHNTPLRVWQYFTSTMISQAIIGMVSLAVMFAVAIAVFNLKVVGDYAEIFVFLVLGIILILGIGLAIGGWAKNERQAAPLSNIVVFPMLFLSGTFFPRFEMPQWLQTASNFLPLTPVIDGVRLLATEGKHLVDLGPQLGLMAIWMVVIYIIAFRVFRWE